MSEIDIESGILTSQVRDDEEKVVRVQSAPEAPVSIYQGKELYMIIGVSATASFLSTVSVPIYLPAFPDLERDFNVTVEKMNLTVTIYSIFQGVSPIFWGTLSDTIGRRPAFVSCLIVYVGACIGLALSPSYWFLFGMRILQAFGGASTVAILNGIIGDLTSRKSRGSYVGIASGLTLMGNCFGPLIGAGITSGMGWRAMFWFLVITAGAILLLVLLILPETNRFIVGDGSFYPTKIYNQSPYAFFRSRSTGVPFRKQDPEYEQARPSGSHKLDVLAAIRILMEWDAILVLIPASLHYTTWFMVLTAQSTLLSANYNFSTAKIGYAYLASGVGSIVGSVLAGRVMARSYNKAMAAYKQKCIDDGLEIDISNFDLPRARLKPTFYPSFALAAFAIVFGWTIEKKVQYVVPILATFFISSSSMYFVNTSMTLFIDLFPEDSASASAVVNLARCLVCAAGLAVVDRMISTLGAGGTFTLMSGICLVSMLSILLEIRIGSKIDIKRRLKKGQHVRL
ncbi:Aqr1p [Sugiyamaella lignohabitans]|uniref:Aqr1p n=1 Tax=Sugiyamaella lignohabitans TaxID=796027 RepID=A0A167FZM1_9ASCO|nr:Aqr1p [Sugiyamaella lignohabitans]ANB15909.1 Aqr1p [Sugiyamaella lignohabitans]